MANSSAKLVLNLVRRVAILESVIYRAFFVHEGADSLGAECVQANKQYDDDSKTLKERQRSGERIDWKARGPPQ
eukprot:8021075-Pyramimonas_sp.AAC.1